MRFEATIDVDVDAAVAWDVLTDYSLDATWRREVESMVPTPPGPATVGTKTEEVARLLGSTFTTPGEVTAIDPGRSLAWRAGSDAAEVSGTREVEPLGPGRCRVRLTYDLRPRGATRLLGPVLTRAFRRAVRRNLPALAELLRTRVEAVPAS